jgi:hypothetical protein
MKLLPALVFAVAILALLLAGWLSGRRRRELRRAFEHYLHPDVLDQIVTEPPASPAALPEEKNSEPKPSPRRVRFETRLRPNRVRVAMQMVISIVLLAAALFIILSKMYAVEDQRWAYGTVGIVIGFWLKGTEV